MKAANVLVLLALAAAAAAKTKEADIRLSDEATTLPAGTRVAVMTLAKGGVVELELFDGETPVTAANFAASAAENTAASTVMAVATVLTIRAAGDTVA